MQEGDKDEEEKEQSPFVHHLPWKFGDLLPWYNVFYCLDYLFVILMIIAGVLVVTLMNPNEAFSDTLNRLPPETIFEYYNYPYSEDEVWGNTNSVIVYFVVPIGIFILSQIWVLSLHDLHNSLLGYAQTFSSVYFFTELFKRLFGFLRPDYLDRIREFGANEDESEYVDGRKSFPSGHSANAIGVLFYTSLYLLGKLRPFDETQGDGFFFQYIIICAPTVFGLYISASRITDYAHFMEDVIAGWIIGLFFSFTCYCLVYYPPIWHKFDGKPKPKRSRNPLSVFFRRFKHKLYCDKSE